MSYGKFPTALGQMNLFCPEMCFYQYLPVKLSGQISILGKHIEPRLHWTADLIGMVCCDYVGTYGLDAFVNSYVYLTAKKMWQSPGCSYNREGWHCDGFLTDDINYLWSDCCPTIFNCSDFKLSRDDKLSMVEMAEQADTKNDLTFPHSTIVRIDQYVVHRVADIPHGCMRTFVKVSISKDKYDLTGNSHNYLLDYAWPMRERTVERNPPQELKL